VIAELLLTALFCAPLFAAAVLRFAIERGWTR
jgi:hypothetical protein